MAKVISVSIDPKMQELLKLSAKKMGWNVSELIRRLVGKHLDLIVNDGEEIPVIMKVPVDLKGNEEGLTSWFAAKTQAVVKALK